MKSRSWSTGKSTVWVLIVLVVLVGGVVYFTNQQQQQSLMTTAKSNVARLEELQKDLQAQLESEMQKRNVISQKCSEFFRREIKDLSVVQALLEDLPGIEKRVRQELADWDTNHPDDEQGKQDQTTYLNRVVEGLRLLREAETIFLNSEEIMPPIKKDLNDVKNNLEQARQELEKLSSK